MVRLKEIASGSIYKNSCKYSDEVLLVFGLTFFFFSVKINIFSHFSLWQMRLPVENWSREGNSFATADAVYLRFEAGGRM